jgi:hypothetical protein
LGHEVFLDYIEKELRMERERKAQLDQRGVALITTSGSLTAVLFALGALVSGKESFHPSVLTITLLGTTLLAFSIAAIFGLVTTRLVASEVGDVKSLNRLREQHWTADVADARAAIADMHIRTIAKIRMGNKAKTEWLELGQIFQFLASVMLTLCVLTILISYLAHS